jgi:hypothetical protein
VRKPTDSQERGGKKKHRLAALGMTVGKGRLLKDAPGGKKSGRYKICDERFSSYWVPGLVELIFTDRS